MSALGLAGSTIAISLALPTDETQAGFEALTYTQIRGVKVVGEIGSQYRTRLNNAVGSARPYQEKIGLEELSVGVELIRIADTGQDLLRAANGYMPGYSYRATRPDGSKLYFSAQMTALMNGTFSPQSIAEQRATLSVTGLVIETS